MTRRDLLWAVALVGRAAQPAPPRLVRTGLDRRLVYEDLQDGRRIPDFSHCGYGGGGAALPDAPVRIQLRPGKENDETARIQAAINRVSSLSPDERGMRGVVLLESGSFRVAETLQLRHGGVVLRGRGSGVDGTTIVAAGTGKRTLIAIAGRGLEIDARSATGIRDELVPAGARAFRIVDAGSVRRGDHIVVRRRGNAAWIHEIGMDRITRRPSDLAQSALHAYAVGSRVCGPNVFLHSEARKSYSNSEPHHRWSVGGLFDNVRAPLAIQDCQYLGTGHGWAGANYVVWNCEGPIVCQSPPTAQNYVIDHVGERIEGSFAPRPQARWESFGRHVSPECLYLAQLTDRLGIAAIGRIGYAEAPE